MVNGTLASEFFTRFWPIRLTYSTTTGSVTRCDDFSSSIEYCLPLEISQLVEYQLPIPRPPTLRWPTASTSSSLPFLMCGSSASPGDGITSGLVLATSAAFLSSFLETGDFTPGTGSLLTSPVLASCGTVEELDELIAGSVEAGGVDAGAWDAGGGEAGVDEDEGCCARTAKTERPTREVKARVRMGWLRKAVGPCSRARLCLLY